MQSLHNTFIQISVFGNKKFWVNFEYLLPEPACFFLYIRNVKRKKQLNLSFMVDRVLLFQECDILRNQCFRLSLCN